MHTKRRRAAPMSAEERRAAIVAAVLPLLREYGADVTTRQIADAAGIAEGTIFRVFPDKRSLLVAAAEEVVAPPGWREAMAEELAGLPDLRGKVEHTVARMVERTRSVLLVLTALRAVFLREGPPKGPHPHKPPPFLESHGEQLHAALAELVFAPHADELSVPPATAARAMRSLVMGSWHPGAGDDDHLTNDEITDLLLHGVARPCPATGRGAR